MTKPTEDKVMLKIPINFNDFTSQNQPIVLQFPVGFVNWPIGARFKTLPDSDSQNLQNSIVEKPQKKYEMFQVDLDLSDAPLKIDENYKDLDETSNNNRNNNQGNASNNQKHNEIHPAISKSLTCDSFTVPENAKYMIGLFSNDGTLIFTPVSVYIMKPKLAFIDSRIARDLENERTRGEREGCANSRGGEDGADGAKEGRVVNMTSMHNDSDGSRKAALAELQRGSHNQPWQDLEIYPPDSIESRLYLDRLSDSASAPIDDTAPKREKKDQIGYLDAITSTINSETASSKQPLRQRLITLLVSAICIDHPKLLDIFHDVTPKELVACLEAIAVFIHGVWIAKSEFFYVSKDKLARNLLIGYLWKDLKVKRGPWSDEVGIDSYRGRNMLAELCVFEAETRVWECKVKLDPDMGGLLEEDVRQRMDVNLAKMVESAKLALIGNPVTLKRENIKPSDLNIQSQEMPFSNGAKPNMALSSDGGTPILKNIPAQEHMLIYHKIEGNTAHDQAQNMVALILTECGMLTRSQIHQIFSFQASRDPAPLLSNISPDTLDSIITLLRTQVCPQDPLRPQGSQHELCLLTHSVGTGSAMHPHIDALRMATARVFETSTRVRKSEFLNAWKTVEGGEKVPHAVYIRILNEIATTRSSGIWNLKWVE